MPGDLLNRLFAEGEKQDEGMEETWTSFGEAVADAVDGLAEAYDRNRIGREKHERLTRDKPGNVELFRW